MKGLSIKTLQCGGLKNYESLTTEEIEGRDEKVGSMLYYLGRGFLFV